MHALPERDIGHMTSAYTNNSVILNDVLTKFLWYRWRLAVHGGIDGYSRIPVYLRFSNNNKASKVMSMFEEAVEKYGLPSRVICDRLSHPSRDPGRASVIVGKCVLNQMMAKIYSLATELLRMAVQLPVSSTARGDQRISQKGLTVFNYICEFL